MKKWFNSLPRIVQMILLFIPGVNWVMELGVRWSHFAEKKGLFSLLLAILILKNFYLNLLCLCLCGPFNIFHTCTILCATVKYERITSM